MCDLFSRFFRNELGGTAIEYALVLSLIAMAILGSITNLGTSVNSFFVAADSALSTANG